MRFVIISQMSEKQSETSYKKHLLNAALAGGVGYVTGMITGLAVGFTTGDQESGNRIGLKTAAGVASLFFGVSELNHTINNAEGPDRPFLHRLKGALATIEGGVAFGIPGAIISYSYDNPWWVAGMGALGAVGGYLQFRERFRKQPDLIFPDGSSIIEDTSFPMIYMEARLPKVYLSDSLADIVNFRKANKEQIVKWAGDLPSTSLDVPHQVSTQPWSPVNAVFITTARHFPAGDPKGGSSMLLSEKLQATNREQIIVNPAEESHFFWPNHPTNFESGFSEGSYTFDSQKWNGFRDVSWERKIVILAQYQSQGFGIETKPENIIDRFWLMDILGEGLRARKRRNVPQGSPIPIPLPNPGII